MATRRRKKKGPTQRKAESIISDAKRDEAVKLALQGRSYAAIGEALGLSKTRAFQLVQEAQNEAAVARKGQNDALLQMELDRLDMMIQVVSKAAFGGLDGVTLDLAAQNQLLNLMDRRAKLLGLYAPVRAETALHGKDDAPPIKTLVIDDAAAKFRSDILKTLAVWDKEEHDRGDVAGDDAGATSDPPL